MISVKQHIPGFVSGVDPVDTTVESLQALFDLPFVQRWASDPNFSHWEIAQTRYTYVSGSDEDNLMAIMKDGSFWVVAYLPVDALPDLPLWTIENHPIPDDDWPKYEPMNWGISSPLPGKGL